MILRSGLTLHAFLAVVAGFGVWAAARGHLGIDQLVTLFFTTGALIGQVNELVGTGPRARHAFPSARGRRHLVRPGCDHGVAALESVAGLWPSGDWLNLQGGSTRARGRRRRSAKWGGPGDWALVWAGPRMVAPRGVNGY